MIGQVRYFILLTVLVLLLPYSLAQSNEQNRKQAHTQTESLPAPGASWERLHQPSGTLIAPPQHLSQKQKLAFFSGLSFFKQPWIRSPASTTARDGLGPLFNANSCFSCHKNGGRSRSLIHHPETGTAVVRVSVTDADGLTVPHPKIGHQVQTKSIYGADGEAEISVESSNKTVEIAGVAYEVSTPTVALDGPNLHGETLHTSLRVAPTLIGLGLLESVSAERLLALEDADDENRDGVSGRVHWVQDPLRGRMIGRFGWKALHATVAAQTGAAFRDDIGITNPYFPDQPCTDAQHRCLRANHGADPETGLEIVPELFDLTVHFTRHIPPPRAGSKSARVTQGQELFRAVGCNQCHVPNHPTVYGEIWPYTDLLLHDMGPALADGRVEGDASGTEWRTPPLWGLGTQRKISGHTELLHDGRAKNFVEAVWWHGGEAERSREAFLSLNENEIKALRAFVGAL
ncbi:MAG: di-heme oxidoredictase family protein [Pseudomonadota bacterium]